LEVSTGDEVLVDGTDYKKDAIPSGKRLHKNPLKGFKSFDIDPETGFPICIQKQNYLLMVQTCIVSPVSHLVIVKNHLLDGSI